MLSSKTTPPQIADNPCLRETFELHHSAFNSHRVFCKRASPSAISLFDHADLRPGDVTIWTDASCSSQDLNGGTAELVSTEIYDTAPTLITSAQGNVFCTQVEMITIEQAIEHAAPHLSGRKLNSVQLQLQCPHIPFHRLLENFAF